MKTLLVAFGVLVILFSTCGASSRNLSRRLEQDKAAQGTKQSDNLTEAEELTQQVLKLYAAKEYAEALPAAKREVEIRERALGKSDPLVGNAMFNLGSIYLALGKFQDAWGMLHKVLDIHRKAFGPESPKLCSVLEALGWAAYTLANNREAEELFRRSLEIDEKAYGTSSRQYASSRMNLADFYDKIGDYPKSIESYEEAIAIEEKADHRSPQLADLLDKCACVMLQAKRSNQADDLKIKARAIRAGSSTKMLETAREPSDVLQGKAIVRVEPTYPPAAKQARIKGAIVVEVTIDEEGTVVAAKALCGPDVFVENSLEAARKWKFQPTLSHGRPTKVIGTITFTFNL